MKRIAKDCFEMSSFHLIRCPYSLPAAKIDILIQDIQREFDDILEDGEFHKFKDILGVFTVFKCLYYKKILCGDLTNLKALSI